MQNNKAKMITRTAMLIAITLVFQNLRIIIGTGLHSQFIIGSLVNSALLVGLELVNIYAAIAVAVIAPVVAYLQGQVAPVFPYLIPIIAVGNIVLILIYHILKNKNKYVGVVIGALAKASFLFVAVTNMLKLVKGKVPEQQFNKLAPVITVNFSWPQLVTALIGGFIAILLIKVLKKTLKDDNI